MSSAILYLAIIAIWAVVLIPRWLHRDSAAGDRGGSAQPDSAERAEAACDDEPGSGPLRRKARPAAETDARPAAETDTRPAAETDARPAAERGARPVVAWRARADAAADTRPTARADARAAEPTLRPGGPGDRRGPWPGKERKRLLAARRRLLGMLLALTAGCGALASTGMAAWWVMVAPSVMLLGYLPLLRAAARADAARREQARARPDRAVAGAVPSGAVARDVAVRPGPVARDVAVRPGPVARDAVAPSGAMVSAGRPAPAPDAEVIDISASRYRAGEQFYDQYADAKLRAVGDLARSRRPTRIPGRASRQRAITHARAPPPRDVSPTGGRGAMARDVPSGPGGRGTRCSGGS